MRSKRKKQLDLSPEVATNAVPINKRTINVQYDGEELEALGLWCSQKTKEYKLRQGKRLVWIRIGTLLRALARAFVRMPEEKQKQFLASHFPGTNPFKDV